jgi:hypothetical protein
LSINRVAGKRAAGLSTVSTVSGARF